MDRRKSKRLSVSLKAERIYGNEKQSVFIEDISERGIHIITSPSSLIKKYSPGSEIELNLELATGIRILLRCITRWAYRMVPPDSEVDSIGLEILNPPLEYIKFLKSISHSHA
jgi:hypothetical protein